MLDEVDLVRAIGVPQVDGEDVEGCIDFTKEREQGQNRSQRAGQAGSKHT